MSRYEKGTIQLTETRDYPLLRQIFQSAYATRAQLFEFMLLRGHEHSANALKHRLARLVKNGLVSRITSAPGVRESLYAITEPAVDILAIRGEPYAGRGCGVDRPLGTARHAVELNRLHLAFLRTGRLCEWVPETEICSRNILTACAFAKDYDAVLNVASPGEQPVTFALEYECSRKADGQYQEIAIDLNREQYVDFILYAATTADLYAKLVATFRHCRQAVAVCLAGDLQRRMFEAGVVLVSEQWRMTLQQLIELRCAGKRGRSALTAAHA